MTYQDYPSGQRYGQYLFNTLAEIKPTLADSVIGTDLDSFYSRDFEKIAAFKQYVKDNWERV